MKLLKLGGNGRQMAVANDLSRLEQFGDMGAKDKEANDDGDLEDDPENDCDEEQCWVHSGFGLARVDTGRLGMTAKQLFAANRRMVRMMVALGEETAIRTAGRLRDLCLSRKRASAPGHTPAAAPRKVAVLQSPQSARTARKAKGKRRPTANQSKPAKG